MIPCTLIIQNLSDKKDKLFEHVKMSHGHTFSITLFLSAKRFLNKTVVLSNRNSSTNEYRDEYFWNALVRHNYRQSARNSYPEGTYSVRFSF